TITGSVVDQDTRRPLPSVQVVIPSLNRGVVAQQNGRFLITGIPAGTYEIEAHILGYATGRDTVRVVADETVVIKFELAVTAIRFDELVVSGPPAGVQRRRAIGTGIASIDVESKLRDAPVTRLQDLLQGREAGVVSMASSGTVGAA